MTALEMMRSSGIGRASREGAMRVNRGSGRDLSRRAGLAGQLDHGGGDGEVLQADAGAVEKGDLLGGAAAGVVAEAMDGARLARQDGGMTTQAPIVRRPATYQDVLDAPPNMVAELMGRPAPASRDRRRRTRVAASVAGRRDSAARSEGVAAGPAAGGSSIEPELHLGDDVLVPDLAGWRRERMPSYPDVPFFELAPDWVCEVLSPGTRRIDLTDKRDIYGAAGVGHLWLVDPRARTLEAFALGVGRGCCSPRSRTTTRCG